MTRRLTPQDGSGVLATLPGIGHLIVYGDTKPSDGDLGYSPGCLFIDYDASGNSVLYINVGTKASCDFDVFTDVGIADSGGLITATSIEGALQELAQHQQSAQAVIPIPLGGAAEQDGTALADYAGAPTPGWNAGNEGAGIYWGTHANPDPITVNFAIPYDLDETEDVVLHFIAAKSGATAGDTVDWTVEAFNNAVGALYDADVDFGGEADAMTGDATAKTVQDSTLTLAAANIAAAPCMVTLTVQPKDGKLGTDDVILLGLYALYTRKTLTS